MGTVLPSLDKGTVLLSRLDKRTVPLSVDKRTVPLSVLMKKFAAFPAKISSWYVIFQLILGIHKMKQLILVMKHAHTNNVKNIFVQEAIYF